MALYQIINKMPKLTDPDFKKVLNTVSNDNYLCLYVTTLMKTFLSIHSLINNRIKLIEDSEPIQKKENNGIT